MSSAALNTNKKTKSVVKAPPERLVIGTGNKGKVSEITNGLARLGASEVLNAKDFERFPEAPEVEIDFEEQAAAKAMFYAKKLASKTRDKTTWFVSDDSGLSVQFGHDLSDPKVLKKLKSKGVDLTHYKVRGKFVDFTKFPLSEKVHVNLLAAKDFPGLATGRIAKLFGGPKGEDHNAASALYDKIYKVLNGARRRTKVDFVSAVAIATLQDGKPVVIKQAMARHSGILISPGIGTNGFGYDANFISTHKNGKGRSFAQMTVEEKADRNPRTDALRGLATIRKKKSSMAKDFSAIKVPPYIKQLKKNPDLWDKENKRWRPNLYSENFAAVAATNTTINSRAEPSRYVTVKIPHSGRTITSKVAFAANVDFNGTRLTRAVIQHDIMSAMSKHVPLEEQIDVLKGPKGHLVWMVLGISDPAKEMERLRYVFDRVTDGSSDPHMNVMFDASNGHMKKMIDFVEEVSDEFGDKLTRAAGNATVPLAVQDLVLAGAQFIKGNHGPAEICDTHVVAGVHSGTITTTLRCAEQAHKMGAFYITDGGGLSTSGNAGMQLIAGADYIFTGGLFAGLRECAAKIIKIRDQNGKIIKVMERHGGAGEAVLNKHYGGVAAHRPIEGRTIFTRLKTMGLEAVIRQWENGIASLCSFGGVDNPHKLRGMTMEPARPRRDYQYT